MARPIVCNLFNSLTFSFECVFLEFFTPNFSTRIHHRPNTRYTDPMAHTEIPAYEVEKYRYRYTGFEFGPRGVPWYHHYETFAAARNTCGTRPSLSNPRPGPHTSDDETSTVITVHIWSRASATAVHQLQFHEATGLFLRLVIRNCSCNCCAYTRQRIVNQVHFNHIRIDATPTKTKYTEKDFAKQRTRLQIARWCCEHCSHQSVIDTCCTRLHSSMRCRAPS